MLICSRLDLFCLHYLHIWSVYICCDCNVLTAILTPAPVDVEGPLVPAIQATWFSKSQLLFVDLAVPLQAHVEEVPSQDEDEMYERLMDQTAQSATRSRLLHLPEEAKRHHFAGGGCAVGCVA